MNEMLGMFDGVQDKRVAKQAEAEEEKRRLAAAHAAIVTRCGELRESIVGRFCQSSSIIREERGAVLEEPTRWLHERHPRQAAAYFLEAVEAGCLHVPLDIAIDGGADAAVAYLRQRPSGGLDDEAAFNELQEVWKELGVLLYGRLDKERTPEDGKMARTFVAMRRREGVLPCQSRKFD